MGRPEVEYSSGCTSGNHDNSRVTWGDRSSWQPSRCLTSTCRAHLWWELYCHSPQMLGGESCVTPSTPKLKNVSTPPSFLPGPEAKDRNWPRKETGSDDVRPWTAKIAFFPHPTVKKSTTSPSHRHTNAALPSTEWFMLIKGERSCNLPCIAMKRQTAPLLVWPRWNYSTTSERWTCLGNRLCLFLKVVSGRSMPK